MLEYAIDGVDGSAKTPIITGVKERLEARRIKVDVHSPFLEANQLIPEKEIYGYWESRAPEAVKILHEIIEKARRNSEADVLLFDRHWMTIMGELKYRSHQPYLWRDFIPTFYIDAPVSKTIDCSRYSPEVPWTSSAAKIEEYRTRYRELSDEYRHFIRAKYLVTSRDMPLESIIHAMSCTISDDLHSARERRPWILVRR